MKRQFDEITFGMNKSSRKKHTNGQANTNSKIKLSKRKKQNKDNESAMDVSKRKSLDSKDSGFTKSNGNSVASYPKKFSYEKKHKIKDNPLDNQTTVNDSQKNLPKDITNEKTGRLLLKNVHNKKTSTIQQTQKLPTKIDRQPKRKKNRKITNAKKKKLSQSESDSDAEDYIEKFFEDVADEEPAEDMMAPDLFDNSTNGSEEDQLSDLNDSDFSEENDGNAMSLEELIDFYGKQRDINNTKTKANKGKRKMNSSDGNNWVEEDNDVDLVYVDSDNEGNDNCNMLVEINRDKSYPNNCGENSSREVFSGDDDDDDEWVSLDGEQTDSQTESESYDETASSADYTESDSFGEEFDSDDHEFVSDYDSDESDELEDMTEDYSSLWDESYNSEDDEDYIAEEDDDLYISRGTAQIYEIDDNEVSFNSDVESAQIVELPIDYGSKVTISETESSEEGDDKADCPKLVPIYDAEGNIIDNTEKLERFMYPQEATTLLNSSVAGPTNIKENPTMENEQLPDPRNINDLSQSNDTMDVEPSQKADSSYRLYDSVDMRMSLLVLKKTLFFSGHLTIQPLIGGLEVMGYCLKPGECRSVHAVRGFHSLNLTPRPETTPSSKQTIQKAMTRLEKHFQALDLKEIQQSFDPSVSVLVLLQADCNNKKIAVVDKYLAEDFLFPKVELLNRSAFFTTQYLLNVEFYTEYVEKSTSLFKSDPEWDKIDIKKNSRVLVMGGKGSGKSTLCQYLVNRNLPKFRKVILIDLDIGQPIHYIPETISVTIVDRPLLGVATFGRIKPVKSWLFGSLNIVSSLIFYIQNVRQLQRYCEQNLSEFANVPWIINTMGYVTDFGEELMAVILRMFSPTDVIQLMSTNKLLAIPNFQNRLTSEFINKYSFNILRSEVQEYLQRKATFKHYELNVCYPKKGFTLNAPKRRFMMLLAHLADILHDTSSEWFNDVKPFCAPLNQLQVLITREDQIMADEQLPSVLNATLVYLCQKVEGAFYECFGIGIVRGVDKNSNVYLLQALPPDRLANVNVLAICSSSLPNAVFLKQSTRIQGSIPYVYNIN